MRATDRLPLPAQVAINQIRPIAHRAPQPWPQLLQKGELPLPAQVEERAPRQLEDSAELWDRIRAVRAAVRLLRWRRRRLERTLARHQLATASSEENNDACEHRSAFASARRSSPVAGIRKLTI